VFEELASADGSPFQMEVDRDCVLVVHHGTGEYRVRLRPAGPVPGQVDLKIFTGGALVARIPVEMR